jgi:hypothetical protein
VHDVRYDYPSWVELTESGGRFVGEVGSSRPIRHVEYDGDRVKWSLPKQYEGRKDDTELQFEAELVSGLLSGRFLNSELQWVPFAGRRAPDWATYPLEPNFGEPVELVNDSLDGWRVRWPERESFWVAHIDGLENRGVGSDLVSAAQFKDFKLVAEYSYPTGSNSGIYLRGRYEYQVLDDHGQPPQVGGSAAIYGFLAPTVNAIRPAGEWNTAEITLIGNVVNVVLNGELVIDRQEIPGITGGALDSREGDYGPILIQGDHGPVTYRSLRVFPVV